MEYYKIAFYDHNKDFVGYKKVSVESFLKARIQASNLLNKSIYPTATMATVFFNNANYSDMAYAYNN
jgi:hypothetical protein